MLTVSNEIFIKL